jgi:muramoyltetrapeptide carboxypeptidase
LPITTETPRTKPLALRSGDTVGIVAPASNIKLDLLEKGCQALRQMGYKPFYFDSILEQDLYFAGSADRRARELEEMFARDEVRAILCARGGYGANYLLDKIDLNKIAANPKIFVGYSDVTTLLTWFADSAGMVAFHGPMVTKDFALPDGIDLLSWNAAVSGSTAWDISTSAGSGVEGLVDGLAEGITYGGCLSLLVAAMGTPYDIRTRGTILFLEDVNARPYQIDRMLMQLKLAGKFEGVKGIVFGEMLDCLQTKEQGYTLQQVILRVVGDLGIPIAYGLRSGHVTRRNITLPIGVRAALTVNGAEVELKIVESATARERLIAHRDTN